MSSPAPAPIKVVAIFEIAKGALALLATSSLIWAGSVSDMFERVERHLDLAHPKTAALLDGVRVGVTSHMRLLVVAVLTYAGIRFAEGIGLWLDKRWAEWLGALSALLYLPFEVIGFWHNPSWWSATLILSTAAVAAILLQRLAAKRRLRRQAELTHQ